MRALIVPVVALAVLVAPQARAGLNENVPSASLLSIQQATPPSAVSLFTAQLDQGGGTAGTPGAMKSALSINSLLVLGPIIGAYPIAVEYEMALSDNLSFNVTPAFVYFSNSLASAVSFGVSVGARYFLLNGPALNGLWVGADLGVAYAVASAGGQSAGALGASVTPMVGYNILFGSFYFSPGVGASVGLGGVGFALRLNVGYGF